MASRNARSRRFPRGKSGLASIIVVTYNNPDYTRLTLESVIEKTRYPHYELIVVDNGSEAETRDWLITFAAAHPERVRLILNDRNLGFPAANNAGIRAAHRAEYIVLLNNDCIVTRGWLSGLIRYLRDPEIGMVGPVTNFCGNEACVNAEYGRLEDLPRFARRYTSARRRQSFDISMLAMFCVAMRRAVVDEIGPLDEQFGAGMFEDDDYAHRVRQAGYRIVCAEDIYVHHFGRSSFSRLHEDEFTATFAQNRAHFESKWATTWTSPCPRAGVIVEPWDEHVERWRSQHPRADRLTPSGGMRAALRLPIEAANQLYHVTVPFELRERIWSLRERIFSRTSDRPPRSCSE